jgi:hypothetical protein
MRKTSLFAIGTALALFTVGALAATQTTPNIWGTSFGATVIGGSFVASDGLSYPAVSADGQVWNTGTVLCVDATLANERGETARIQQCLARQQINPDGTALATQKHGGGYFTVQQGSINPTDPFNPLTMSVINLPGTWGYTLNLR